MTFLKSLKKTRKPDRRGNRPGTMIRSTFRTAFETLEGRQLLAADPYLVPVAPSVETTPILTVTDAVPESDAATDPFDDGSTPQDGLYRMVGIPDGMGAYDNGDGTFTVLMNHELGITAGIVRDHGAKGAFVSKWIID